MFVYGSRVRAGKDGYLIQVAQLNRKERQMNVRITAGVFAGGEIEPGTFHVRVPDKPCPDDPQDGSVAPAEAEDAS